MQLLACTAHELKMFCKFLMDVKKKQRKMFLQRLCVSYKAKITIWPFTEKKLWICATSKWWIITEGFKQVSKMFRIVL